MRCAHASVVKRRASRPRCGRPTGGLLADARQLLTIGEGIPLWVRGGGCGALQHQGLAVDASALFGGSHSPHCLNRKGTPVAPHGAGGGDGAAARCPRAPVHGLAAAKARVAGLGVAVVTAWGHLLTAFPGVARVVGPFDLAVLGHCGFHAKSPRGDCQTGYGRLGFAAHERRGRWMFIDGWRNL